jgi:hypothetical protein
MQISVETEILETIFLHAKGAARIASFLDNAIVLGALNKSINEIGRLVAGLLGKPYAPKSMKELTRGDEPEFDVAIAVDDLRQLVARADALASAAERLLDEMSWSKGGVDRRRFERLAHLIGATFDAVQSALAFGDKLAVEISTRRPGK